MKQNKELKCLNVNELIELENNIILKCTDNHRFYTLNRGWVEAKDLIESDELFDI